MKKIIVTYIRLIFRWAVGIGLILLGIAGIILPILPGWVFVIMGITLITPKYGDLIIRKLQGWAVSIYFYMFPKNKKVIHRYKTRMHDRNPDNK